MTGFDTFAMVDWSGGNDTGPRPRPDAIWAAVVREGAEAPAVYLRNRAEAERWLSDVIRDELAAGRRLCLGFDFPFGYPAGFAKAITGGDDPLALWDWLEARIQDAPDANNRFDLAGQINAGFPGTGPFWGNALKRDIADLPRLGRDRTGHGMPEKRQAEEAAKGAFALWQLAGAGAAGSQTLMGLPVLARLRRRFAGQISVWPFEDLTKPIAFLEIWPSLLGPAVTAAMGPGDIKDAVQVQLVARALSRLAPADLAGMLDVSAPEEGWIFGLGHVPKLMRALAPAPPALTNDCFALPAGVDWTPVDTALAHLKSALGPVVGMSQVPVLEAGGRVLAEAAHALRSNPPAANSAVDGYGFAGAAPDGAQAMPLVSGRAAAGVPFAGHVPAGHAVRILTGASVPTGVDTVVLEEDTRTEAGMLAFHGPVRQGANTRKAGEDVTAGTAILPRGRCLTSADLALLSAVGLGEVSVFDRIRVGVLSTGDELVEPGDTAHSGQIFDANRPMLLDLVRGWGAEPVDLGRCPDDRGRLKAVLDHGARQVDVILTSGGASAGDEDHVSALLRATGSLNLWRIAVKPGRPLALGLWEGVPVFGLPGNPVAALICALIFARPAIGAMAGAGWQDPQGFDLPAAFEKRKKPGRREYLRARVREGRVEVFASEGSGRISGLSWADGLVELPDGALHVRPGDPVRYLPFAAFGLA